MSSESDQLKALLTNLTPQARLKRLQDFFNKARDLPAQTQCQLDFIAKEMVESESGGGVSQKGLLILAKLEHLMDIVQWNSDPDTIRGESLIAGAAKGGNASKESRKTAQEDRIQEAVEHWYKLTHIPERNRAARIAQKMDLAPKTIRQYLKAAKII